MGNILDYFTQWEVDVSYVFLGVLIKLMRDEHAQHATRKTQHAGRQQAVYPSLLCVCLCVCLECVFYVVYVYV